MNNTQDKDQPTDKGLSGVIWICLIALGFIFELASRFFGMEFNPSGLWLDFAPLLGVIVPGLILLFAVFRIMRSWTTRNLHNFRFDMLLLLFGATMLMSSYIAKTAVPLVFA